MCAVLFIFGALHIKGAAFIGYETTENKQGFTTEY